MIKKNYFCDNGYVINLFHHKHSLTLNMSDLNTPNNTSTTQISTRTLQKKSLESVAAEFIEKE
jgi:dolichyl-phosphate-mannose--protein O-mannosyl transferase